MTVSSVGRQAVRAGEPADLRALVGAAQASDSDAWEALYRRAYPRLVAYATRRLEPQRALDAVAETMARAVAGIGRFEWNGSGFDGWLFGILRHVVLDAHRARARETRMQCSETQTLDPGPLERVLDNEEATAVRAAFAQLGPADRELLELRVIAGLSSEDVATVLGKRPGAVRTAQARALQRLRRHLRKQL